MDFSHDPSTYMSYNKRKNIIVCPAIFIAQMKMIKIVTCGIVIGLLSQDFFDDKSALVQVMAWCR